MTGVDIGELLQPDADVSVKAMAYKTVNVFAGIKGRKLWLKDAPDGIPKTDGYLIEVPFAHKHCYWYLEHEISHIIFDSDAGACAQFVERYASLISQVAERHGAKVPINGLRRAVHLIVATLDDERVISLWGKIYQGSEAIMRHMKESESLPYVGMAQGDMLTLFYCLAGGHDVPTGPLDRYIPYMVEAIRRSRFQDYCGVLVTAKWLVTMLVKEIIRVSLDLPPPKGTARCLVGVGDQPVVDIPPLDADLKQRAKAMETLGQQLDRSPLRIEDLTGEVRSSPYGRNRQEDVSRRRSDAALNADVHDEESLAEAMRRYAEYMDQQVETIKDRLREELNPDDRIRQDAYARVVFTDVTPSRTLDPYWKLQPRDDEVVRRLRTIFFKVMGRRTHVAEDMGIEVDIPAYIERKLTRVVGPIFRAERLGRGFSSLILIDRSKSMRGARTEQAERACQIIARALRFPFVRNETWGFQSLDKGEVNLTRFPTGQERFDSDSAVPGGATPLHTAIRVAVRHLQSMKGTRQLFVISDGRPEFARSDGKVWNVNTLMGFVRNEVHYARSRGIAVIGVMIGTTLGGRAMPYMFGSSRYWRIMSDDRFAEDLIQLVSQSFIRYLQGR